MARRFTVRPRLGRFRARKRQGAWNGVGIPTYSTTANTPIAFYLWDDLVSSRLNMAGRGVHQRTLYWLSINGSADAHVGWYIHKFTTDVSNNVPSASIFSPLGNLGGPNNFDHLQKDLMEFQYRRFYAGTTAIHRMNDVTHVGECRAKRRLDDTDGLLFVLESNVSVTFSLYYRTYVTW